MKSGILKTVGVLVLATLAIIFYCVVTGHGFSGQIRLDTGDLRYCFLGVPYSYERIREPERSPLLSVARDSDVLRPEWHTCVRYPLPTTNNTDLMCVDFYRRATAWVPVDRSLARLILEDIARYIVQTNAQYSLPDSCSMLVAPLIERDDSGLYRLARDWQDDEGVRWYCERKGYTLAVQNPTTAP